MTAALLVAGVAVFVQGHRVPVAAGDLPTALAIDYRRAPRTVIIVLRQGCEYCDASLPFYRRLIAERNRRHSPIQIAVAAPESDHGTNEFLAAHGVAPDVVVHFRKGALPLVHVVPSILVATPRGQALYLWQGALSSSSEQAVIEEVF